MKTIYFELASFFFRLGILGFGGPAAHIALMQKECVEEKKWLSEDFFLDLIGATNLIPGPNSTQMTMHVGYHRAGIVGMLVAGGSFILPAVGLTLLFSWFYVSYGTLPQVKPILQGMLPAILAVITTTLWKMSKKAMKSNDLIVLSALVCGLLAAGLSEVLCLLLGGLVGGSWLSWKEKREEERKSVAIGLLGAKPWFLSSAATVTVASGAVAKKVTLGKLSFFFFKIACILYGSGYVLIAFLEGELVHRLKWLTSEQLLHAVALGQITPGPVLTTSTAIGLILSGWKGAIIATLSMFLPSFVFVAILHPLVPNMRKKKWLGFFLDALNASAVALMIVVFFKLGAQHLMHWLSAGIACLCFLAQAKWKLHAFWLILFGALVGASSSYFLSF